MRDKDTGVSSKKAKPVMVITYTDETFTDEKDLHQRLVMMWDKIPGEIKEEYHILIYKHGEIEVYVLDGQDVEYRDVEEFINQPKGEG